MQCRYALLACALVALGAPGASARAPLVAARHASLSQPALRPPAHRRQQQLAPRASSHMVLRGGSALLQLASVQKVLELGSIAVFGAYLRSRLDASALTTLLLKALVPAVILSSLASLSVSPELMGYVGGGALLLLLQFFAGHASALAILGGKPERATLRRSAALQVGTMAPVLSVFAFIREFVGAESTGYAALVDLPSKAYMLLLMPLWLKFRGDAAGKGAPAGDAGAPKGLKARVEGVLKELSDPFNAAILLGLLLAATGTPVAALGPVGAAVKALSSAQTPVLFLLIGMKFKVSGGTPAFCLSLLLARHGIVALGTAAFLKLAAITDPGTRLAAVLSSQAATSIVGYGQIDRVAKANPKLGYDTGIAFDVVGISYPLTIMLNTAACIAGAAYVDRLPVLGAALLALAAAVYAACKDKIDAL